MDLKPTTMTQVRTLPYSTLSWCHLSSHHSTTFLLFFLFSCVAQWIDISHTLSLSHFLLITVGLFIFRPSHPEVYAYSCCSKGIFSLFALISSFSFWKPVSKSISSSTICLELPSLILLVLFPSLTTFFIFMSSCSGPNPLPGSNCLCGRWR